MIIKPDRDKGSNPKTPLIRVKFRNDLTFIGFIKDCWLYILLEILVIIYFLLLGG